MHNVGRHVRSTLTMILKVVRTAGLTMHSANQNFVNAPSSTLRPLAPNQKVYDNARLLHSISVHFMPTSATPRCPKSFTLTLGSHGHSEHTGSLLAKSTIVHSASKVPDFEEDRDAAHTAFINAFESAKPSSIKIPGLQEFAGSIWERRRRIPSQLYNDPLSHLFQEFDLDSDGSLTAAEISEALVSRGVHITPDQVQIFIEAADSNDNHKIEQNEFADLIFHMASADLNRAHHAPTPASDDDTDQM